jgi:single-strand DNA-binding protein
MQQLIVAGNVGKDAELRRTQGGDAVLNFSLACDNGKDASGNRRDSTWYDCSIWGKRAESLEAHIKKGCKLTLSGRPTVRVHNEKAYLGISVQDLTFQGGNAGGGQQRDNGAQSGGSGYGGGFDDSDIPF